MAFSDLYEVIDRQSQGAEPVLNVYHVQRVDVGKTAIDIFNAYDFSIAPSILDTQTPNVVHDSVTVRSLDDPFDFHEGVLTPNLGNRIGEEFAQFYAFAIQFNRTRTDMRNGQKRWLGGVETDALASRWDLTFQALMTTLGTALIAKWQIFGTPNVDVCDFVVINRICNTLPSPPCLSHYRLPENDGELKLFTPVSFTIRDTIRSQVSRKVLV